MVLKNNSLNSVFIVLFCAVFQVVLFKNIEKRIKKVNGDIRQDEIIKIWKKELFRPNEFFIASFKIKCSSGTYVRGLVNSLGNMMKIPALAFSIKRTKVGKYML